MEEYYNKWNINMNTLGLADCDVQENVKVYGFVVHKDVAEKTYLEQTESECVRLWYNYHCQSIDQITDIHEFVLPNGYTESDWNMALNQLTNAPLKNIPEKKNEEIKESEYLRYSMICNGLLQGAAEDVLSEEQMKQYGYGLIYWEDEKMISFFDNRMAVTFRKLSELKQQGVVPVCIKIKKLNKQPIPVADGRKQLVALAQQENLKHVYNVLQTINCE